MNVGDITSFEKFLRLVAIRTGQILNLSDLARDAGVSVPTAKRWISVLQSSYQVYLLEPFHANLSKRLIKSPKIYFGDTALASYLMGLHDEEVLLKGPFLGPLFETAVLLEHIKWASYGNNMPAFSYFRTKDGLEVDLMIEEGVNIFAREIKSNRTLKGCFADNLFKVEDLLNRDLHKVVLAPIEKEGMLKENVSIKPWTDVEWL